MFDKCSKKSLLDAVEELVTALSVDFFLPCCSVLFDIRFHLLTSEIGCIASERIDVHGIRCTDIEFIIGNLAARYRPTALERLSTVQRSDKSAHVVIALEL